MQYGSIDEHGWHVKLWDTRYPLIHEVQVDESLHDVQNYKVKLHIKQVKLKPK